MGTRVWSTCGSGSSHSHRSDRAAHEGWPEWFGKLGDALVDMGSPMKNGAVLRAEDRSDALELVRDHPLLALGPEYTIEVFEVPRK